MICVQCGIIMTRTMAGRFAASIRSFRSVNLVYYFLSHYGYPLVAPNCAEWYIDTHNGSVLIHTDDTMIG
jgi:hypothetical protein